MLHEIEQKVNVQYRKGVMLTLLQDLAESWFPENLNPRIIADGLSERIAERIKKTIGIAIHPKLIRDYKAGKIPNESINFDLLATCWLQEMGLLEFKKGFNDISGNWHKYDLHLKYLRKEMAHVFDQHREEDNKVEYKREVIDSPELADLICAFANTNGGHILFGVDDPGVGRKKKLIGLDKNARALTKTNFAIARLSEQLDITKGWIYYAKEGMFFYLVKVEKSNFLEPVKSLDTSLGNIAYRRVGEKTIPFEQEAGKKLLGSKEMVTKPRQRLIENYCTIKSILHNYLEYNNGHKSTIASEQELMTLFAISFRFIADTFIIFLMNLMNEINYKQLPKGNEQLYQDAKTRVEQKIEKLRNGEIKTFLEDVKATPELHTFLYEECETLCKLFNLLQIKHHENGTMEYPLLNDAKEKSLTNTAYPISPKEIYEIIFYFNNLAKKIDSAAGERYNLEQNRMTI